MANNLYRKQKRQYSTDNGVTWKDVEPPVYQVGALIEENSDCSTEEGSVQYRWFTYDIDEQYTCDTEKHIKYNLEVLQYSYDGRIWQNTTETRRGSQMQSNSFECGYIAYEYREVEYNPEDPNTWICGENDCTKYTKKIYMSSRDGVNWVKVEPEDAIKGRVIEEKSVECGYVLMDETTEPKYLNYQNNIF